MYRDFKQIIEKAGKIKPQKIIVAGAEEENLLLALEKATLNEYIQPILVGNSESILKTIEKQYENTKCNNNPCQYK